MFFRKNDFVVLRMTQKANRRMLKRQFHVARFRNARAILEADYITKPALTMFVKDKDETSAECDSHWSKPSGIVLAAESLGQLIEEIFWQANMDGGEVKHLWKGIRRGVPALLASHIQETLGRVELTLEIDRRDPNKLLAPFQHLTGLHKVHIVGQNGVPIAHDLARRMTVGGPDPDKFLEELNISCTKGKKAYDQGKYWQARKEWIHGLVYRWFISEAVKDSYPIPDRSKMALRRALEKTLIPTATAQLGVIKTTLRLHANPGPWGGNAIFADGTMGWRLDWTILQQMPQFFQAQAKLCISVGHFLDRWEVASGLTNLYEACAMLPGPISQTIYPSQETLDHINRVSRWSNPPEARSWCRAPYKIDCDGYWKVLEADDEGEIE